MAGAYDDRDGVIWMDGDFVPWREAKVHVLTHALHYASSVFEGERAYGGAIFKSREHSERLLALLRPARHAASLLGRRDRGGQGGDAEEERASTTPMSGALVWRGSGEDMGVARPAQPGPHGDRGLGVGRLLRRRQDEGREARRLEVEAAEPGDDPERRPRPPGST